MIQPADIYYESEIGQGNGGIVKKAIHKRTGIPLAIKIINVYDKSKRHQLYNELKTMKHLDNPYLLKCYGAFFEEGSVRLVLEYMDCGSMETVISVLNQLADQDFIPRMPELVISRIMFQVSTLPRITNWFRF
jgi:serine/threonine protein kinase